MDSIPPGTWYFNVCGSVNNTFGFNTPSAIYLSLIGLKYSATCSNFSISRPGFLSISENVKESDSVGGWLVPPLNGDIAVSIISTPASTAFIYIISAIPPVQWVWRSIGMSVISFIRFTKS